MSLSWSALLAIILIMLAGGLGGLLNSLLSDNLFLWVKNETYRDGRVIMRYGFIINALIGAFAALISWGTTAEGLYIIAPATSVKTEVSLSVVGLVSAMVIGIGGSRWLTNEVDKRLLKTTASLAAESPENPRAATSILNSTPKAALHIVNQLIPENTRLPVDTKNSDPEPGLVAATTN